MDYQYFRDKPVPKLKQRERVEWILTTARESSEPKVSSNTFIYDFRIPRISAHIFNMREDLWEIETIKENNEYFYKFYESCQVFQTLCHHVVTNFPQTQLHEVKNIATA